MTGEGQMKCRAVENPRAGFIQVRSSREEQILLLFELVWAQQGVFDSFWAASVKGAGSLQRVWRLLIPDGDGSQRNLDEKEQDVCPPQLLEPWRGLDSSAKICPPYCCQICRVKAEYQIKAFCWSRGNTDSRRQG